MAWKLACLAVVALAAAALVSPCAAQNSWQDFVSLHNAARQAVGVPPVSWDANVAAYAESYAAQRQGDCALIHSSNRPYGENLYMGPAGKDWSVKEAVDLWVAEQQWYDYGSNSCVAGQMCGHYTQVVWRDTTAIGCARVRCNNGGTFIICSYNPPGNTPNQRPY